MIFVRFSKQFVLPWKM